MRIHYKYLINIEWLFNLNGMCRQPPTVAAEAAAAAADVSAVWQ